MLDTLSWRSTAGDIKWLQHAACPEGLAGVCAPRGLHKGLDYVFTRFQLEKQHKMLQLVQI